MEMLSLSAACKALVNVVFVFSAFVDPKDVLLNPINELSSLRKKWRLCASSMMLCLIRFLILSSLLVTRPRNERIWRSSRRCSRRGMFIPPFFQSEWTTSIGKPGHLIFFWMRPLIFLSNFLIKLRDITPLIKMKSSWGMISLQIASRLWDRVRGLNNSWFIWCLTLIRRLSRTGHHPYRKVWPWGKG